MLYSRAKIEKQEFRKEVNGPNSWAASASKQRGYLAKMVT
jgi:hypothetical protein